MTTNTKPLFALGQIVSTPGVLESCPQWRMHECLVRHVCGDWGDLSDDDRKANDEAVKTGLRILSAYDLPSGKIWIITEADRSVTTFLLPEEY